MSDVPRRQGRPPLDPDDPSVDVHVRVPAQQFDALCQRARDERCTVPEVIRRQLHDARTRQGDDDDEE